MIQWLSHAFIAQLVEHLTRNEKVSGSIPDVGSDVRVIVLMKSSGAGIRLRHSPRQWGSSPIRRWNKIAPFPTFPTSVGLILGFILWTQ